MGYSERVWGGCVGEGVGRVWGEGVEGGCGEGVLGGEHLPQSVSFCASSLYTWGYIQHTVHFVHSKPALLHYYSHSPQ